MLGFKQFLREMPRVIELAKTHTRDGDNAKIKKGGVDRTTGLKHIRIASTDTHHIYRSGFQRKIGFANHAFNQIYVARKDSGEVDFHVSGNGDGKKKTFDVGNVTSNLDKDPNIKYHHIIHHLVNNGHIKEWHSDRDHSKGSVETYRKLAAHPDLTVHHEADRPDYTPEKGYDEKEIKVTPKNFNSFYKKSGKFIVRKKKK